MSMPRATTYSIPIVMFDASDPTTAKTGLSFASGDAKISKDGGAFASTTNTPTELADGVYWLTLTAAETDALVYHVRVIKATATRYDFTSGTHGMPSGTVVVNGGNTATTFLTNRTETVDDYWKDSLLVWTTGGLIGQVKKVSAYTGSTKFITLSSAFTAAPSTGDQFILVNR